LNRSTVKGRKVHTVGQRSQKKSAQQEKMGKGRNGLCLAVRGICKSGGMLSGAGESEQNWGKLKKKNGVGWSPGGEKADKKNWPARSSGEGKQERVL